MSDYDFKTLNDKEFEILCADLIGNVEGRIIERFKPGKDSGVDGRFFSDKGGEVVLQCKHWVRTPLSQLISTLKKVEKPKLEKLNPQRYILAVSNPLSRTDKKTIKEALSPYLKRENDIYGNEDLNDRLKERKEIEQRHYKLWLHSTSVLQHIFNKAILGRSQFSLEEIHKSAEKYVITENHYKALEQLEKLGVVIISGEPGVGKSTLAEQLCLFYVAHGFNYIKISDEIREAESIFDTENKQVFYFDDFLGRNYLAALKGHEGNHITQFIRRVSSNKKKRFILTSRSTVLNQGKFLIDAFEHNNLNRNEYELKIISLSELDKGKILYNHIWYSSLTPNYIEQLYLIRRYRKIINHRNFNPRLISFITDITRLEDCPSDQYWQFIIDSLTNPSQIWENPFTVQLDDYGRAIVFLTVLNGKMIDERDLSEAYTRFITLSGNQGLNGRSGFLSNIRLLTGAFLNRTITNDYTLIQLFNPSIGDYIIARYAKDLTSLKQGLLSLLNETSLYTIVSLVSNNLINEKAANKIYKTLLEHLVNKNFSEINISYISRLFELIIKINNFEKDDIKNDLVTTVQYILVAEANAATECSYAAINWGLDHQAVTASEAIIFIKDNVNNLSSYDEIRAAVSLLSNIPDNTSDHELVYNLIKKNVIELISDCFTEFIETDSVFSTAGFGESEEAYSKLSDLVESTFNDLGISIEKNNISFIMNSYDVEYELEKYYIDSCDEDHYYRDNRSQSPSVVIDEIDDLFDRG
jgi:adenylate kinase family enzyme